MLNDIDLLKARQDTPGCSHVLHLNNAGASLMPRPVLEAMVNHLRLESQIGGYEAADQSRDALEHVYNAVAELIGCQRDEIAIVENATRAWDMAFYAIQFEPGDRILTSVSEYASNYLAFLQVAARTGARVEVVPNDEFGQVSIQALGAMIDHRVKLIAITHVPTNGGLVNPAAAVGRVAREAGVLYLLDACQSMGQMPVNVNEIGCDLLSATGRKFLRGPRGIGFLHVRRQLLDELEPPFLDLHAATWTAPDRFEIRPDARRFENWEANQAAKVGLGVAVDYALTWGLEAIWNRVLKLAGLLRTELSRIPGVTIRDIGQVKCGIVSFDVNGRDSSDIARSLRAEGINVSTSSIAATRLDMEARGLENLVRASVHYYNTEEEIARFCAMLARLVEV